MDNYNQQVEEFKNFLAETSLEAETKLKYLDLFAQKGYLSDEERASLVKELQEENRLIDKFIKTNL